MTIRQGTPPLTVLLRADRASRPAERVAQRQWATICSGDTLFESLVQEVGLLRRPDTSGDARRSLQAAPDQLKQWKPFTDSSDERSSQWRLARRLVAVGTTIAAIDERSPSETRVNRPPQTGRDRNDRRWMLGALERLHDEMSIDPREEPHLDRDWFYIAALTILDRAGMVSTTLRGVSVPFAYVEHDVGRVGSLSLETVNTPNIACFAHHPADTFRTAYGSVLGQSMLCAWDWARNGSLGRSGRWRVFDGWQASGAQDVAPLWSIDGTSASGAAARALRGLWTDESLPPRIIVMCAVAEEDGRFRTVGVDGVTAKAHSVLRATDLDTIVVTEGNRAELLDALGSRYLTQDKIAGDLWAVRIVPRRPTPARLLGSRRLDC